MNFRAVYSLAVVLTRSQVRGTQRNKFLARVFGEPRVILPVDITLLFGLGGLGYALLSTSGGGGLLDLLRPIEPELLADIPSAIMFMAILFGVLYEISQPIQSMNTDLVNWLPITPMEYVGASTISESYIYSFMVCLFLGVVLGPALALGMVSVWVAAAFMAVVALFAGAAVVEVLDATTNRISSSFYKKSGRSGIVFRLIATVILLVFIQLLFSGYVVGYLLQSVMQAAVSAWFIPVVWPTLAVLGAAQANMFSFLLFSSSSIVFAVALFGLAATFRGRFWVPVPVSIKLSTRAYQPRQRQLHIPLIGAVESAMIQKDFRSLTRRREMARFLAIPFVLAISMGITLLPLGTQQTAEAPSFMFVAFLFLMPVAIFVGALSMTSIGQEGYAVWNLYAAPISPTQLLRAKLLFTAILGVPFAIALLSIFALLLNTVGTYYGILLPVSVLVVLEVSALGVYFAALFPDFREMVRSRYVSVWGSLMGIGMALAVSLLTVAPLALSIFLYGSIIPQLAIISFGIGLAVFIVALRVANNQIQHLFQNIQT
ncbi:MAG: hypothetical protein ACLP5V_09130 [Candidatus Bathyarchaeia archaeon]